jgi:integrase
MSEQQPGTTATTEQQLLRSLQPNGLRLADLSALMWGDISLKAGTLTARKITATRILGHTNTRLTIETYQRMRSNGQGNEPE